MGEGAEESLARAHLTIGLCYSLQASDGKSVCFHSSDLHSFNLFRPHLFFWLDVLTFIVMSDLLPLAAMLKGERDEFNRRALHALQTYV